jgi:predicted metal-dependent hydrolase
MTELPVITRKPRAKSMRLTLDPVTGQAHLTLPLRVSHAEAMAFWTAHQGWVARQRAKIPEATPFEVGAVLPLFGQPVELQHARRHIGRGLLTEGTLIVGGDPAFFARRIRDFIKDEAAQVFRQQADTYAQQLGARVRGLAVKDTHSRWGSCTTAGQISLSWRLAFAPQFVSTYVVAHEVAHLREMNHSPRFWAHVAALVEKPQEARSWLKHNGHSLLRFGAIEAEKCALHPEENLAF